MNKKILSLDMFLLGVSAFQGSIALAQTCASGQWTCGTNCRGTDSTVTANADYSWKPYTCLNPSLGTIDGKPGQNFGCSCKGGLTTTPTATSPSGTTTPPVTLPSYSCG